MQNPPEGRVYRGPKLAIGYGVFVRYDDELREWRVHAFGMAIGRQMIFRRPGKRVVEMTDGLMHSAL